MWNKPFLLLLYFLLSSFFSLSQIADFTEKFELPYAVEETSGLLFFDGKIITQNDSGDAANLYEIDSLSGNLLRTIRIDNASNVDWEDLADDKTYIYIGDFGNNNGTRTNLKIYRILKSDFKEKTTISAEIISFSYENQTNFTSSNNHNFDAEAFVIYHDSILIFTKNRGDFKTNVYKIPKTIGNHTALKISSANVNGLITGATYNKNDDSFFLCGYDSYLIPFLIYINKNRMPGEDIFFSGFQKTSLYNELGQGSQVEGITHIVRGEYYISREFYSTTFNGNTITFPQKLYQFTDLNEPLLSTLKNDIEDTKIYPNPTSDKLYINSQKGVQNISVYNVFGEKILVFNSYQKALNTSLLSKGVYILRVQFEDKKSVLKKFIKL